MLGPVRSRRQGFTHYLLIHSPYIFSLSSIFQWKPQYWIIKERKGWGAATVCLITSMDQHVPGERKPGEGTWIINCRGCYRYMRGTSDIPTGWLLCYPDVLFCIYYWSVYLYVCSYRIKRSVTALALPLSKGLLIDGRERESLLFEGMSTARIPMLQWMALHPCTEGSAEWT